MMYSSLVLVLFTCLICSSFAHQFNVGGKSGWVTEPSENYNQWSRRMRFQVNDILLFKYKKGSDSVLVVNKEDYDKCNTEKPILKLEDGNSIFKFDRSGPFYFISGNKEHCQNGQKLTIVVLAIRNNKNPPILPTPPEAPAPSGQAPVAYPPKGSTPSTPAPGSKTPGSSPVPSMSPLHPSPGGHAPGASHGGHAPGPYPAGNAPGASPGGYGPGASPGGHAPGPYPGGYTPGTSPGGHAPGASPARHAPSPYPEGHAPGPYPAGHAPGASPVVSPAPTLTPTSSQTSSPAATPGSPTATPGSPTASSPSSGNTPADINSPNGSPSNSAAVSAFTPTVMVVSTVSVVMSVALGGFMSSF